VPVETIKNPGKRENPLAKTKTNGTGGFRGACLNRGALRLAAIKMGRGLSTELSRKRKRKTLREEYSRWKNRSIEGKAPSTDVRI